MKNMESIALGDKASFEKTLSESDVYLYAGISGDFNPAHINAVASEKSIFKKRIVHGMLTASFISTVLGCHLPGPGTIYLKQEVVFKRPVYMGDTITAEVEVMAIDYEKKQVSLKTTCTNQDGIVVIEGSALVKPPAF